MDNYKSIMQTLYVEILGTMVDENILKRLTIPTLENRLKLIEYYEKKIEKIKKNISSKNNEQSLGLLMDIMDAIQKMRITTNEVLKHKRNNNVNQDNENNSHDNENNDDDDDDVHNDQSNNYLSLNENKTNEIDNKMLDSKKEYMLLSSSLSSLSVNDNVSQSSSAAASLTKKNKNKKSNVPRSSSSSSSSLDENDSRLVFPIVESIKSANNQQKQMNYNTNDYRLKFNYVFNNDMNAVLLADEWKFWFDFSKDLDESYKDNIFFNNHEILSKYFDKNTHDKNINEFERSLVSIFADDHEWNEKHKFRQIEQLSFDNIRKLQLFVECIHHKCIIQHDIEIILKICQRMFDKVEPFKINFNDDTETFVSFGELLSAKCRSIFFKHQQNIIDPKYCRNAKLISNLCRLELFNVKIIIPCFNFICYNIISRKQHLYMELFRLMIKWIGIDSIEKKLLTIEDSKNINRSFRFMIENLENYLQQFNDGENDDKTIEYFKESLDLLKKSVLKNENR